VLEIVVAFLLEDGEKFRQYRLGTRRGVEAGNDFFASENLKRIQEVQGIFELIGRKAKEFQIMKARELQMRLTVPN
jgi:hypothetical protein